MGEALWSLSAVDLLEGYRAKQFSPSEVMEAVLARMEAVQERCNAFCYMDPEAARAAAKESSDRWAKGEARGRLDGVPATIKDVIVSKGWPTLRGSKAISPEGPWEEDAPAVARMREQGALFFAKTTTPEFGWKGITDSALCGITRNPWDPSKTPGGSSGGAAAAAALGAGPLHFGTDGGGSIRIPCGFSGIPGIKPTFGRVPAYPASPFGTVAHLGPMTRTVTDSALMLAVITAPDPRDWYALPQDPTDHLATLGGGIAGLKVAFSPNLGGHAVDPEIAALVAAAAKTFEELGAFVEETDPALPPCGPIFQKLWFAGAAKLLDGFSAEQQALMDPGLRKGAAWGAEMSAVDYLKAVAEREAVGRAMNAFHRDYDLLLTPTLPIPAFAAGQDTPDAAGGWVDWTPFSYPFNLTQQPAMSVPCGLTEAGLPAGLQIVGPKYADALVMKAAAAYEAAVGGFPMPDVN